MSFTESYQLAETPAFQARVAVALVKSAVAVMNEAPATVGHAARMVFAGKVLEEPERWAMNAALAVVTNAAITAASNDGDLEFTVNSMWNAFSGVGV